MSTQNETKKDVKGKGREIPLGEPASAQSAQIQTDEQESGNGILGPFHDLPTLPARPSPEVTSGTIQWLRSIPIPPVELDDQSQNHELHRTLSEPGAGNSGALRPDLVHAGEGIFRTVLMPGICASPSTPQPWEENNLRSRSNSAADANGRQMKMGLRPHSKSVPILRRPIFSSSNTNQPSGSSENGGPIHVEDVLRLLCPNLPNEFQSHALFGYNSDGAADEHETGLPDFIRGVGQANVARSHEQSLENFRSTPGLSNIEAISGAGSSSEAASRSLGQGQNRSYLHQPSPLSIVDTIEHAPLVDPPLISRTGRSFSNQVQNMPPLAQSHHIPAAQAHQDTSSKEPSDLSDVAGNIRGMVREMPTINQVLEQSTSQFFVEGYTGLDQSHPPSAQLYQLHQYQPVLLLPPSGDEEFITMANISHDNFIPPAFENSHGRRQHSPHASTLVWSERPKSRWRRIWQSLKHSRRGCLCSSLAGEVSEADTDTHEPDVHTTESVYQPRARTHYAYILGWRGHQENFLPPLRNSQIEEVDESGEPGSSRNEPIHADQEIDDASTAPTLVPPKGFLRRLKDRINAMVEKHIADRAAKIERRRMRIAGQTEDTRTQDGETVVRTELAHSPSATEEDALTTGALTNKDR